MVCPMHRPIEPFLPILPSFLDLPFAQSGEMRQAIPGENSRPKPSKSRADKCTAARHQESPPMSTDAPVLQDKKPANLTALQRALLELATKTKPAKPTNVQGPVMIVRGK